MEKAKKISKWQEKSTLPLFLLLQKHIDFDLQATLVETCSSVSLQFC